MKNLFLTLTLLCSAFSWAQYTTYEIENVGTISVSDDMELQADAYAEQIRGVLNILRVGANDRVVFQQKNLNTLEEDSFGTYACIIVETYYGDYATMNPNQRVTVQDLQTIGKAMKQKLQNDFSGTPIKLLSFLGTTTVKINNQLAIKSSYTRQYADNPPVRVDYYVFQNRDRTHNITLSYRIEDATQWKNKLQHSINSVKIIKR